MTDNLPINYADPKAIDTIKNTVAKDATPAELSMFIEFAKSTGLNPFKRELWFIKANGRVQMMTGIQGFFAIANDHAQYDGEESGLIDPEGNLVPAEYAKNDYIGAWCTVHRKDRKIPSKAVAMLSEYDKKQSNWNAMKRVMITKCAQSVALRKAFPQQLNGLYTEEEAPAVDVPVNVMVADDMPEPRYTIYNVMLLPEEKRAAAISLLTKNRAEDMGTGVWRSARKIPKLVNAEAHGPVVEVDRSDLDFAYDAEGAEA
jgi:phage recombination protein Bet